MKTTQTFRLIIGLGLGLASAVVPQPVTAADSSEPVILDLSKFQKEKFLAEGKTNQYWQTVFGRQVFDGLPFQIAGRGCVYGTKMGPEKRNNTNTYPDHVGIQVGCKFDELHLLHVTQWADAEGREIARIRLNYADGSNHEFPILFGGQVRDWHRMPSEEKELLTDPNTKIVWRAPGVPRVKSTLRLFKTVLGNPRPEKEVATMDVVSTKHLAAYDLIAATLASRDPSRAVTPPRPPDEPERKFDGTCTVRVTARPSGELVAGAVVQPTLGVDGVSVIGIPFLTSAAGEGVIRYPVERTSTIMASAEKDGFGSRSTAINLGGDPSPATQIEIELSSPSKLTGVARDGGGSLLAGVEIMLWPPWRANSKGAATDSNGHFSLTWNPENQNQQEYELFLIARDLKRNLALAQTIEDNVTNVDLRLEPGLTITGIVTDTNGKPLTNAEAQVSLLTERMGAGFGKPVRADAQGRFEIKALPTGRRYGVNVSAKGYGTANRGVTEGTEGQRLALERCELVLADQRIAGVVLDEDDKPVAEANIHGYGEGQPSVSGKTDSKGRFAFDAVCAGQIRIQANTSTGGYGSAAAEGGETNVTVRIGSREEFTSSRSSIKITGTVTDPEGKPAAKARVSLFPSFSTAEKQADAEGRFTLTYDPRQFGSTGGSAPIVIARDLTRNLAAAVDLEEEATNATVRLEPAITLAGRVVDPDGKPLTNAQANVWFHTERMASDLGSSVRADADGKFEIKALPQGRQYTVRATARGFGQDQRPVPASEAATNRIDVGTLELLRADQKIAGVVLDDDDKPVAGASIYSHGDKQPGVSAQTDSKGRFTIPKVCAGSIQLHANSRSGGYANMSAEAGDTNIVIRISSSRTVRMSAPQTARLKGKPLPDLAPLGLTPAEAPADQPLLAVLIDAEQRPSRRVLRLLAEQSASLKEKGVAVIVLQAGGMADDAFKSWKQEAALPFPVGCFKENTEKARAAWGAGALPWLILTDKAHRVTADGFALDELDAKLKDLAK
jgi:protocatechuate 3,4-dioxygenase beta subunit